MSQNKKITWKNILFLMVILLLIIPQTRLPIQVGINKVKVALFSPSAFAKANQQQIEPFTYKVMSLEGLSKEVAVGSGKITFISYWATWCPPCIAELPSIASLYKDYVNRIQFLLITNERPAVVEQFLIKKNFNLPAVNPQMETPEVLFERSIPTNYIIDGNGTIVIKEKGASDWNSKNVRTTLDALLAED